MDPLSSLLAQVSMRAGTFFNGTLCGDTPLYGTGTGAHGQLHLLRAGSVTLHLPGQRGQLIHRPSVVFFPRGLPHRLRWQHDHPAQLICATLAFDGGARHPLAAALPDHVVVALDDLPGLANTLEWIYSEAGAEQPGQSAVLDRLLELLVIQLLRGYMGKSDAPIPLLSGLADRHLGKAMAAIHDQPAHDWSLEQLATLAQMSRSRFAAHFRQTLGCTPGEYLLRWRMGLVQRGLRDGKRISVLADSVGYQSPAALARAFRRCTGQSPREWLGAQ